MQLMVAQLQMALHPAAGARHRPAAAAAAPPMRAPQPSSRQLDALLPLLLLLMKT